MSGPFDAGPGGQQTHSQPGRNERGQWISNDATGSQAFEALADAVAYALLAAGKSDLEDGTRADLIKQGFAVLAEARDAAELMDAGQRPARDVVAVVAESQED